MKAPRYPLRRVPSTGEPKYAEGFTLMEMLVVVGIISVLLAIAVPALRHREGIEMEAASRQLITDLSIARNRAISGRTTVSVVFVPSSVLAMKPSTITMQELNALRRLQGGVYTQYALFSARRAGDQPGHPVPRYLTEWKTLPDKTFIAEAKFAATADTPLVPFDYARFPFPLPTSTNTANLPYVAFNYEGRPCKADGRPLDQPKDLRIPLARGAILYARDATDAVTGFSVNEVPPLNSVNNSNHVVIDWLSGRARIEHAELYSK